MAVDAPETVILVVVIPNEPEGMAIFLGVALGASGVCNAAVEGGFVSPRSRSTTNTVVKVYKLKLYISRESPKSRQNL